MLKEGDKENQNKYLEISGGSQSQHQGVVMEGKGGTKEVTSHNKSVKQMDSPLILMQLFILFTISIVQYGPKFYYYLTIGPC